MAELQGESSQDGPHQSSLPSAPQLQAPFELSDTAMRDTPDMATGVDQRLNFDTSDDDDVDSMTDVSSMEESHLVPRGLPLANLPTGLCYDERMRYHSEVSAPTGDSVHPEDPRRIYYIFKELCEAGLVDMPGTKNDQLLIDPPLMRIDAREATREEICLVHTPQHYEFVKNTAELSDEQLIDLSESPRMDSIYFNALSYYSGKLSAGGVIETCKAVAARRVKNAIAVVRPPGHHAEVNCTMGFCLFNNTCIASRVLQNEFGEACRKILILDWDVHHGNGCQKAFYDDPNILYISLHVHMDGRFYPAGDDGDMYHVGEGLGVGKNINIPWEFKGMGDGDYMYAFQHVVMPIATEFDPDMVIVSAGFDAAAGDELGGCFVSPPCYAHMTHMLMSLSNGKVAVCLEGGYNFQAISRSALAVTRTLMGEPPDRLGPTQATQSAIKVVQQVRRIQSKYWKSVYPKEPVGGIVGGEALHDIIREWQAMHLFDKYRFTELHILRDNISPSFNKQVLATADYEAKPNLLVFFHDPPDLMGQHDPLSGKQKLHETWLTYAELASAYPNSFGMIDINIPEHITITANPAPVSEMDTVNYSNGITSGSDSYLGSGRFANTAVPYMSGTNDLARKEAEKLAVYIWENYIDPYEFEGIYILGAGNAFQAVQKLVADHESVHQNPALSLIVSFIANQSVRPISNSNNPWLGTWFSTHSRVYVAHDHQLWKRDKISKRYGLVIRSPEDVSVGPGALNRMMMYHRADAWAAILATAGLDGDTEEEILDEDDGGEEEQGDDGAEHEHEQHQTISVAVHGNETDAKTSPTNPRSGLVKSETADDVGMSMASDDA